MALPHILQVNRDLTKPSPRRVGITADIDYIPMYQSLMQLTIHPRQNSGTTNTE